MDHRMTTSVETPAEGRVCDVCRLLRHDVTPKTDSRFCPVCQAWLCDACRGSMTQRAVAAILHAGELLRGAAGA